MNRPTRTTIRVRCTPREVCNRCSYRGGTSSNPICREGGRANRIQNPAFMCPLDYSGKFEQLSFFEAPMD